MALGGKSAFDNPGNILDLGSALLIQKRLILNVAPQTPGGTLTANGATAVTVANSSFTANSVVTFSLKTVGGTVGALPRLVTATPGTGFTAAATAGDTSVYNYSISEVA